MNPHSQPCGSGGRCTEVIAKLQSKLDAATAENDKLRQERDEALGECLEQAGLLGRSGDREADLLSKIDQLNRRLAREALV
jgi:hypothetical protein